MPRPRNRIARTCKTCQTQFEVQPHKIRTGGGLFCSRRCYGISITIPLEEQFLQRLGRTTEDGCIIWAGLTAGNGYGVIGHRSRNVYAHRIAYERAHGPIPDGLWVLHRCDNPLCINPDHLFLGTQRDNIDDMVSKNRQCRGESITSSKLTADLVREIRTKHASGRFSQRQLAREYHVGAMTINKIINRRTWAHIT